MHDYGKFNRKTKEIRLLDAQFTWFNLMNGFVDHKANLFLITPLGGKSSKCQAGSLGYSCLRPLVYYLNIQLHLCAPGGGGVLWRHYHLGLRGNCTIDLLRYFDTLVRGEPSSGLGRVYVHCKTGSEKLNSYAKNSEIISKLLHA